MHVPGWPRRRSRSGGRCASAAAPLAALLAARQAHGNLELVSLKDVDPGAVCADGSPAGYYWEAGSDAASPEGEDGVGSLWIMHLQGGEWCFDQESCGRRCGDGYTHPLCSSKEWQATFEGEGCDQAPCSQGGLFQPSRTAKLQHANKAFVRYCTSDAHIGDGEAFGLQFRGARVVRAVLKDLLRRGLGEAGKHATLLLGGASAGARGAMVMLDEVASTLAGASGNLEVVGFLDSPLWLDVPPLQARAGSFTKQTQDFMSYSNVSSSLLGAECTSEFPGDDSWKCLYGEYRMPFVKTKYLLVASQNDQYQLEHNLGHEPEAAEEVEYVKSFARRVRAIARRLSSPTHLVLSWSCYSHMLGMTDRFDHDRCEKGSTMQDALEQVLGISQHPRPGEDFIDSCDGFACGGGCSGDKPATTAAAPGGLPEPLVGKPSGSSDPGAAPLDAELPRPLAATATTAPPEREADAQSVPEPLRRSGDGATEPPTAAPAPETTEAPAAEPASVEALSRPLPLPKAASGSAPPGSPPPPAQQEALAECGWQGSDDGAISLDAFRQRMLTTYASVPEAFASLHQTAVDLWSSDAAAPDEEPMDPKHFALGCQTFEPPLTKDQALYAFGALDADGDGLLTMPEFSAGVQCGQPRLTATSTSPGHARSPPPRPLPSAEGRARRSAPAAAPLPADAEGGGGDGGAADRDDSAPSPFPDAAAEGGESEEPEVAGARRRCAEGPVVSLLEFRGCMLAAYESAEEAVGSQGSSAMTITEFTDLTKTFKPPLTEEQAEHFFKIVDSDGDGILRPYELLGAMSLTGHPDQKSVSGASLSAIVLFAVMSATLVVFAYCVARGLAAHTQEDGKAGGEYWAVNARAPIRTDSDILCCADPSTQRTPREGSGYEFLARSSWPALKKPPPAEQSSALQARRAQRAMRVTSSRVTPTASPAWPAWPGASQHALPQRSPRSREPRSPRSPRSPRGHATFQPLALGGVGRTARTGSGASTWLSLAPGSR